MKHPETRAQLRRFSWTVTGILWLAVLVSLALAFTVAPEAINAAVGVGIVAVLLTVLSALDRQRDDEDET